MELSLNIILDELAVYNPIIHKKPKNQKIGKFRHYDPSSGEIDNICLYVVDTDTSGFDITKPCPKHLIAIGGAITKSCFKEADTVIQITPQKGGFINGILQIGFDLFESFEAWNRAMLLAIINRSPISDLLEIAAAKLANPIALFDNRMHLIAKAGIFINSPNGTIWEKVGDFDIVVSDFFTIKEQRMLSEKNSNKSGMPYVYHPAADNCHTYATSSIWINEKLYGNIGTVDINAPFTDSQLDIISHINEILKLYFKSSDEFRRIAENKQKYLDSLLEGTPVPEEIVRFYLNKAGWKISGEFYFLSFECPISFTSPVESSSYIKLIIRFFPKALISVFQNRLIAILRRSDYLIDRGKDLKQLEKVLRENEMWCGISTPFDDFMRLRYYYGQSIFAAEYCKTKAETPVVFYEECFVHHILRSLGKREDLPVYCHPKILSLWNGGKEGQRELVHSLYQFLLNGRNIALTVDSLHVHRNTLIYRLGRLSEILDTDLKTLKDDQLFFYFFSCLIVMNMDTGNSCKDVD
jgi:hypothetical protein